MLGPYLRCAKFTTLSNLIVPGYQAQPHHRLWRTPAWVHTVVLRRIAIPSTPMLMAYTCMYMQATCYKHQGPHISSNLICNSFYAASVCVCARVIVLRPILTVTSSMLHPCVHTGERSNHELVVSALQTLQLAALSPFARKAIAGEAQDWSY